MHLVKNALQSEDFSKRWLLVYVWTDENGTFRIRDVPENDSNTLRVNA